MLDLELTSVKVEGRACPVRAETEAVIGGSSRARALGATPSDEPGADPAPNALTMTAADRTMRVLFRMLFGSAKASPVTSTVRREPVVLRPGATLRFTTATPAKVRVRG
jgi:hypothetical protein